MDFFTFTLSSVASFFTFNFLTGRKYRIFNNLPKLRIKFLQLFPSIKIFIRGRTIHLHHWFNLSIILVITIIINAGVLDTLFARGIILGGLVQGFTFNDWSKIVYFTDSNPRGKK